MGVSYVKFCPRCQTTTSVDSALCPRCGHRFRILFQPEASEKTIAMVAVPGADGRIQGLAPLEALSEGHRPALRPHLVLVGAAFLAALCLLYSVCTWHPRRSVPIPRAVFQPYDIVIQGGLQDDPVPLATQSVDDLQRWAATQSPQKAPDDDASVGDDPAHVRLYRTRRIVLIPPGTPGRVLLEREQWRRVQILGGIDKGAIGYISRDAAQRPGGPSQETANATR